MLNMFRKNKILFFDPRWETSEKYDEKYKRLLEFVGSIGNISTIWGVSAGASLAVRLGTEHSSATSLKLVCGKVYGPGSIGIEYQRRAPAFVEAVTYGDSHAAQLRPEQVTCYVPKDDADGVIKSTDMIIPSTSIVTLPKLRHSRAILFVLLRYLPLS